MTRVAFERLTCDRCQTTTDLEHESEERKAWGNVVMLEPRERTADLCPPCVEAFGAWVVGGEPRPGPRPTVDRNEVRSLWEQGATQREIAEATGVSAAYISQLGKAMGLPARPKGRPAGPTRTYGKRFFPSGGTNRRHVTPTSGRSVGLTDDHPAILEARTLFPTTVVEVEHSPRLLVSGENQRKIGRKVLKGLWKGMPIYCLTLEERKTCPTSCKVWNDCYGNNMHLARRHKHGPALEARLRVELAALGQRHPEGFVVRLHILGDFYSANYAMLWLNALREVPQLRLFGFTAHEIDTDIGQFVSQMNIEWPTRCRIRFSGGESAGGIGAIVVENTQAEGDFVVCPAQSFRTESCSTCGLCWTMNRTVAFARHGEKVPGSLAGLEDAGL